MGETELESMVVRLLGDGSSYMQMMQQAQESTAQTAQHVQQSADRIEGITTSVTAFAGAAAAALAFFGVEQFLGGTAEMYRERETAVLKLGAAMRANGGDVEEGTQQYLQWAKAVRDATGESVNETLTLLRKAESYRLAGEQAKKVVEASRALAAVNDGNAESFMRIAAAVEKGDIKMAMHMARLVPQLRGIKDQSEFVDQYNKLVEVGVAQIGVVMGSSEGSIKKYELAWKSLKFQFGELVEGGMRPFRDMATDVINTLTNLDPWVKKAVVSVALLAAGFLAARPIIAMFSMSWTYIVSTFSALIGVVGSVVAAIGGPLTIALVAVAAIAIYAGKVWLDSVGGLSGAWELVKEKASAFWNWLVPIGRAALGVLSAGWEIVKGVASAVWDFVASKALSFWEWLTGLVSVDSAQIQNIIVTSLVAVEFGLRNLEAIFSFVWTGAQYKLRQFYETMIHVFSVGIPSLMSSAKDVWIAGWTDMFNFVSGRGSTNYLQQALDNAVRSIPERVPSVVESALRTQFDTLGAALSQSWEVFRDRRLKEIFGVTEDTAANAGQRTGRNFADAAAKEMKKFDAALASSAEALTRIAEYQDRVSAQRNRNEQGRAGGGAGGAIAAGSLDAAARILEQQNRQSSQPMRIESDDLRQLNQLTRQVVNNTDRIASQPQIEVEPADFA